MSKEFSIVVNRLHSGDIIIGRQTPKGGVINPFFILVEYVQEIDPTDTEEIKEVDGKPERERRKVTRRKISLRPFIELIAGLTTMEDNYFIDLPPEAFSNDPWQPLPGLQSYYMSLVQQMSQEKQKEIEARAAQRVKDAEAKKELDAKAKEQAEKNATEAKEKEEGGPTVIQMEEGKKE